MNISLIIRSKMGRAEVLEKMEKEFDEAVKEAAKKALNLWNLTKSDFIIIKDKYPVEVKLPITPKEYEIYSKYNIRKSGSNVASFELPIYVISYNNEWVGNDYRDYEVFVVVPFINDKITDELVKWAEEITSTENRNNQSIS